MKIDSIKDYTSRFTLDVVSCRERPIVNVLESFNEDSGVLYIIMCKLNQLYCASDGTRFFDKEKIIEENFAVNVIDVKKITSKVVKKYLSNNIPMIVDVDLRMLFYARQYMRESWPHGMLIKGYDEYSDVLYILDNEPYSLFENRYVDNCITYEIVEKAHRSYKKIFCDSNGLIAIRKKEDIWDRRIVLIKTLQMFLDILDKDDFCNVQIVLMNQYVNLINLREMDNTVLIESIRKKLVNVNKYIALIFEELSYLLEAEGIEQYRKEFIKVGKAYRNEWEKFTVRCMMDIEQNKTPQIDKKSEISKVEEELVFLISEIIKQLRQTQGQNIEPKNTSLESGNYVAVENNEDFIITENNNGLIFNFTKRREYNWWIDDNAPKVVLVKKSIDENKVETGMRLNIDAGNYIGNYEVGFFIRTAGKVKEYDKSYMISINDKKELLFSRVGVSHKKIKQLNYDVVEMQITVDKECVYVKIKDMDEDMTLHEQISLLTNDVEIGVACKVWNNVRSLKISCENMYIVNDTF